MPSTRLRHAGFWLGLAFGGFFDGILLHQVLQWHHLLSGLSGGWFGELRHQVIADGLFHALMYMVGAWGLVQLVRSRGALAEPGAASVLASTWLIGFGAWHGVDAVVSHWLLGIHRVRMDTPVPLAWDLAWVAAFGVLPVAAGLWQRHRAGARAVAAWAGPLLVASTLAAAWGASGPPSGSALVVLGPAATGNSLFLALANSDGRVVGSDATGRVWLVRLDGPMDALQLYRHGAVYVSGTLAPAGCSAWFRMAR